MPDAEPGRIHFQSYCAACHQYDGQGAGEAPPLDGSPWVTGPEIRLINIVLHGVHGPMEVSGKTYNQEMPGFGRILSDADVASLLTFVRKRFGAPSEPITSGTVSQVRAANHTGRITGMFKSCFRNREQLFASQSKLVADLHNFSVAKMYFDIL